MNELAKDVTVHTGFMDGIFGSVISFLLDPKTWAVFVVCGVIAWAIKKVFDALPKSVLIILLLLALAVSGYLKF